MGAAFFYHLTERPLESTLPVLLSKSLAAGWRVAVRGQSREQLTELDRRLWLGEGFLPHGVSGGDHDALQPVLLTTEAIAANDPNCVMSVAGAEVTAEEVKALERVAREHRSLYYITAALGLLSGRHAAGRHER